MTAGGADAQTRLRVLLTTMDFPPTRGGIQTMAREILARAVDVSYRVVAPADPGHRAFDAPLDLPIRRAPKVLPGRRGYVPGVAFLARREARRWRPDAALAMHVLAAPGPIAAGVPTVVIVHGGELRSARIARAARWVLPRAARVVANSAYTRTAAVGLGADPMRTTVVPVGAPDPVQVDPAAVEALKRRLGDERLLLSVGRLAPHKGFDRLIRAMPDIPDARLVIVGGGGGREQLNAIAREAGVADRVVLAGAVDDEELAVHYAAADAFVLLSRETGAGVEGGGIVLLEALAYGLPVVAASTGGIPETIRDAETGLLVDPEDGSAVVRVLRRILDDRELAERVAAAGKAMATGERSWTKFVERIERVLDQAAPPRAS